MHNPSNFLPYKRALDSSLKWTASPASDEVALCENQVGSLERMGDWSVNRIYWNVQYTEKINESAKYCKSSML